MQPEVIPNLALYSVTDPSVYQTSPEEAQERNSSYLTLTPGLSRQLVGVCFYVLLLLVEGSDSRFSALQPKRIYCALLNC